MHAKRFDQYPSNNPAASMFNQFNGMFNFIQLLLCFTFFVNVRGYELKQVLMFSRHHIRTPLTTNLELLTPKKWPNWNGDPGFLTPKGRLLERYMGKYFSDWMIEKKLFDDNCPEEAFVYANTRHRTKETAKSFVEGAFGDCVSVYYKNITEFDPVFNPIIRNTSSEFKDAVIKDIRAKLSNLDFKNAFNELNRIVDFGNSPYCRIDNICDLNEFKSDVVFELNKEPDVSGAIQIGNILVDAFLMAYYDGMALENVAWGQIETTNQWRKLLKIKETYHELRFETKPLDKDVASNLLEYMTDIFQNGNKKFYLLVGHDANINSLTSSLRFKDFALHDQLEKTPIGGKLVFQKWYDEENDQDLLKVNYVYQSMNQIRDGAEISLQNPPQWELLQMQDCAVDKNGFCPWNDFMNILNSV